MFWLLSGLQLALKIKQFFKKLDGLKSEYSATLHLGHISPKRAISSSEEVINVQATASVDRLLLHHQIFARSSLSSDSALLGAHI